MQARGLGWFAVDLLVHGFFDQRIRAVVGSRLECREDRAQADLPESSRQATPPVGPNAASPKLYQRGPISQKNRKLCCGIPILGWVKSLRSVCISRVSRVSKSLHIPDLGLKDHIMGFGWDRIPQTNGYLDSLGSMAVT